MTWMASTPRTVANGQPRPQTKAFDTEAEAHECADVWLDEGHAHVVVYEVNDEGAA